MSAATKTLDLSTMNPLAKLIRQRMAELGLTFIEVGKRGQMPAQTVAALATKTEHRQPPRTETMRKLAKALEVSEDVVRTAAAAAAGFSAQNLTLGPQIRTLEAAEDVRIVAAIMGEMTDAQRQQFRTIALSFRPLNN